MQLQLQLLQHLLLLLLLPLLLLGCCCRCCCRSVAILAMPSVRLSTIVCSDDDADEDQDEARPGSHCSNNNCTGNGNGHVDAAAERTMQRAQVHFSWRQLRTAAPVIDLGYRTPKRQNSCMHRQTERQTGRGKGVWGMGKGRQTDRQAGWQAGRQAPVRALAGLICMRSNFQGFCCCRRDSAIILRVAFDISDTI